MLLLGSCVSGCDGFISVRKEWITLLPLVVCYIAFLCVATQRSSPCKKDRLCSRLLYLSLPV